MEINISKVAKALEKEHSHVVIELLMMLLRKGQYRHFTPTYEDLIRELSPLAFNLGLDLNEIIKESCKEEPIYDSESFIIPTPTFLGEYLFANQHLQKEVAKKYGWSDNDEDPEWMKTADYIYNVYYKPTFGTDEEWEGKRA